MAAPSGTSATGNSKLQSFVSAAILQIHRFGGDIPQGEFYLSDRVQPEEAAGIAGYKERDRESGTGLHQADFTFAEEIVPNEVRSDEEYFLFAGRVEALKGIDIAVRAFEKLPDKKLYVAGNGPMMEEMQRYVREHHMENVKFLGYLQKDEMSEKFYQAKAVIMTSQCYEAFAMTDRGGVLLRRAG